MVLGKLPVPGHPTIWNIVGQGPTVLAEGAGGVVWTFLLSSFLSLLFLSLSLGDSPIETAILSQRAVKPKTTNQPTKQLLSFSKNSSNLVLPSSSVSKSCPL